MASKLIDDGTFGHVAWAPTERSIDNGARAVLQRMLDTGAKITRFSRTLISNYLKQLVEYPP